MFCLFLIGFVGAIGFGVSQLAAQLRLGLKYTHYYNSVKSEFSIWRLNSGTRAFGYLNGAEYGALARDDPWLRTFLYTARCTFVMLWVGVMGTVMTQVYSIFFS